MDPLKRTLVLVKNLIKCTIYADVIRRFNGFLMMIYTQDAKDPAVPGEKKKNHKQWIENDERDSIQAVERFARAFYL